MDVHIQELIGALERRGHEVRVVSPETGPAAGLGSDGGRLNRVRQSAPKFVSEILELIYNWIGYRRLQKACRDFAPDLLYERYNLYLLCGAWFARRRRLPFLVEVNAPLYQERRDTSGLALGALARWCERSVWKRADAVLPVSGVLAEMVQDAGVAAGRITVIPNGVNRERFPADADGAAVRRELGLEGKCILGFTGFVRPWHGLEAIVDLLAKETAGPDLHLLIVGDGPARPAIEARAADLGVSDRVSFLGVVPRDRVPGYVSCFDVALQPDVVPYASPLKLFEYMALGRPIVAPDTANIREILEPDRTALLFRQGDSAALAACVGRLAEDAALRTRLGAAASAAIEARGFLWDRNAERVERLGDELGEGAAAGRSSDQGGGDVGVVREA